MAITSLGTQTFSGNKSSTNQDVTITIPVGTTFILVWIGCYASGHTPPYFNSATLDPTGSNESFTSVTEGKDDSSSDAMPCSLWYLRTATTGSKTLRVNVDFNPTSTPGIVVKYLSGVKASGSPVENSLGGTQNQGSRSLTNVSSSYCFCGTHGYTSADLTFTGGSEIAAFAPEWRCEAREATATANASFSITASSGYASSVAVALLEEPSGGVAGTDSGSGSELAAILSVLTAQDAAAPSELVAILGTLSVGDTSTGAESASILGSLTETQSGSGAEAVAILGAASDSQAGSGSEVGSISAVGSDSQSGSGAEAITAFGSIAQSESTTASESGSLAAFLDTSESGSGGESGSAPGSDATDSGSATEFAALVALLTASDFATEAVLVAIAATATLPDSGAASESFAAIGNVSASDLGSLVESVTISGTLVGPDAGTGTENPGGILGRPLRRFRTVGRVASRFELLGRARVKYRVTGYVGVANE